MAEAEGGEGGSSGARAVTAIAMRVSRSRITITVVLAAEGSDDDDDEEEAAAAGEPPMSIKVKQLEDPADSQVKEVLAKYRLAKEEADPMTSRASAKQAANERRLKLLAIEKSAREEYEAKLTELRGWVEDQVLQDGEVSVPEIVALVPEILSRLPFSLLLPLARAASFAVWQLTTDVWVTVRQWFEAPPPMIIDGVLVRDAVALTVPRLNSLTLINALGTAMAKQAATVMTKDSANPKPKRAKSAPSNALGTTGERGMAEQGQLDAARAAKTAQEAAAKAARAAAMAAAKQAKQVEAERAFDERGAKALRRLAGADWAFGRVSRTDRSVLVRWYGGKAPARPKKDGTEDDTLAEEWERVTVRARLHDVRSVEIAQDCTPSCPLTSHAPFASRQDSADLEQDLADLEEDEEEEGVGGSGGEGDEDEDEDDDDEEEEEEEVEEEEVGWDGLTGCGEDEDEDDEEEEWESDEEEEELGGGGGSGGASSSGVCMEVDEEAAATSATPTGFRCCGTFGCILPDGHPGLHAFPEEEMSSRRRAARPC